tara:strand:- start:107 stop:631 length:525 start_codon:yes stop_codon:yes gene_type:complete
MSGNTSLAAAKRRRNPPNLMDNTNKQPTVGFDLNSNNQSTQKYRESNDPIHPLVLMRDHDKKIFILERKLELLEENIFDNDGNLLTNNSEQISYLEQNNNEIKLLKTALQKQNKQLTELTSTLTSLKGMITNHNNDIHNIDEQLERLKMGITNNNISKDGETSMHGDDITLNIS